MEHCGRKSRGFTLVELLVSILVAAIGMVGLLTMDMQSTRWIHSSYLRSQAILQAREMADRMMTNPAGVADGDYSNISGFPASPPTCKTSASTTTINCSAAQIASFDLNEWNTSIAQLMPTGAGSVSSPVDGVFTITVSWQEIDKDAAETQSFSFAFRPLP